MQYNNLPQDIILITWQYIESNKDMCNIKSSCKKLNILANKFGFIKHIKLSMNSNYMNFIYLSENHKETIDSITIEYMDYPQNWLVTDWKRCMNFINCNFGNKKIEPPLSPNTKILNIYTWNSYSHYNILQIDWSKLPNLTEINITTADINLNGIENCTKLKKIILNVYKIYKKELPENIANLPNLKTLITNCESKKQLNFISTNLEVCICHKKIKCSAISNKLPKIHLTNNNYINTYSF